MSKTVNVEIGEKYGKQMVEWKKESVAERLIRCMSMLYLHGCLSESERNRIEARIIKVVKK